MVKKAEKEVDLDGECCVDEFWGNCGMRIVYDLEGHPVGILKDLWWARDTAIIAFSENHLRRVGHRLATYIRKNKLGKVRSSTATYNNNSGNKITAWYWTVDHKAFEAWGKKAGAR